MSDKKKPVEDIYRLSELQEAMLVHRLRRGDPGSGIVLLRGTLRGPLDRSTLDTAWRQTLAHHPALRSSVHWEKLRHPVQVVASTASLDATFEDWRSLGAQELESRFGELVAKHQRHGLDLGRAPVMSWTLVRSGDEEHRFVWACHHVLLDGWSSALVLHEVLARYAALRQTRELRLPTPPSFREYVTWSRSSEAAEAAASWEPQAWEPGGWLSGATWAGEARADKMLEQRFGGLSSTVIEAWARRNRVTAASLVLGCWGLVLFEATGTERPVLGFAASGRAAPIAGIETMVGMFANSLPLQLAVDRQRPLPEWFADVLIARDELQAFEHCPLPRLLQEAGFSLRRPPFDSLVAFANFPGAVSPGLESEEGALHLADLRGGVTSALPLTLAVDPTETLRVEAHFDDRLLSHERVAGLVQRLGALARSAVSGGSATVGQLLADTPGNAVLLGGPAPRERAAAGRRVHREDLARASTPTEAQLMRIWNDLIEVQEYGPEGNFFDLGGHSLLVPQMIRRVQQDFGVELPIGSVFAEPTVRALAAAIDSREARHAWRSLVSIRRRGTLTPLFMVHGLGGEIGWFYNLANYLNPELPLYGLQAPAEPFSDLEAMAAHYVDEILECRPRGPYRLGGYCIGGGVAFEMARQLTKSGHDVSALVLIDSVPQSHVAEQQVSGPTRLVRRARHLMAKEPREIVASIRDFGQRAARGLSQKAVGVETVELPDVLDMTTLPRVYHQTAISHFRAMRDYAPRAYDGDLWLFRTRDERFGEDFGWRSLVRGRLAIEQISGGHTDVLKEPHVAGLGRKLSQVLAQTDDR